MLDVAGCRRAIRRTRTAKKQTQADAKAILKAHLRNTTATGARLIKRAVQDDAAHRYKGVADGLHRVDDLAPTKGRLRVDPAELPVIWPDTIMPEELMHVESSEEFRERFAVAVPALEGFDWKAAGLSPAGGSVGAVALNDFARSGHRWVPGEHFDDVDVFLVGHTPASALAAIDRLGRHLAEKAGPIDVYRTERCITFALGRVAAGNEPTEDQAAVRAVFPPVQVVLRLYSTHSEVIHGFDLGPSAMLWDGDSMWLTALGRLAFEHRIMVLNLPARRLSHERRIEKYFCRGFALALPNLDIEAFIDQKARNPDWVEKRDRERAARGLPAETDPVAQPGTLQDLPYLCWNRVRVDTTQPLPALIAASVQAQAPGKDKPHEASDYSFQTKVSYGANDALMRRNMALLGRDPVLKAGLCGWAPFEPGMALAEIKPLLDADRAFSLIVRAFDPKRIRARGINTPVITALLGDQGTASLMMNYFLDGQKLDLDGLRTCTAARVAELARLADLPLTFMEVEADTALTGPFPREVLTPREWYGPYYRE